MKFAVILGTRPEIIKISPVVKALEKSLEDFFILHTGQHYSPELDEKIFADLEMPQPKYNLGIGGEPYRKQIGFMTNEITKILEEERPAVIIVQGDTSSVLAGALAALRTGVKIAHQEAGLRSHDTSMLEETNRIITDHNSHFLFPPTDEAFNNLLEEGIDEKKVHKVGNSIVDAVLQNIDRAEAKGQKFGELGLTEGGYILASAHRAENVDVRERLEGIIEGLKITSQEFDLPVILSLHPRTRNKISEFKIEIPKEIICVEPVGFLDLLKLEKNAKLVMTDSGGLQEEAFILGVPCVTLRDNTERPETVEYGANMIAGTHPGTILRAAKEMIVKDLKKDKRLNPFGEGDAAEKMIKILRESL